MAPPPVPDPIDPEVERCCVDYIASLFATYPDGCDAYTTQVTPATCPLLVPPLSLGFLGGAAANGETYNILASETQGVQASICQSDWTDVFGSLSEAVAESAPLPCDYQIPEPPPGMAFDHTKVNVKYTPPGADPTAVSPYGQVAALAQCADALAWYFDSPGDPTKVLLCPAACEAVETGLGGTVDVLFGCATIPLF